MHEKILFALQQKSPQSAKTGGTSLSWGSSPLGGNRMQGLSPPPGHVTARSARGLSLTQPVTARTCSRSVENVVGAVQSIARPRNTGNQSIASLGSEIESSLFYDFFVLSFFLFLFSLFCLHTKFGHWRNIFDAKPFNSGFVVVAL